MELIQVHLTIIIVMILIQLIHRMREQMLQVIVQQQKGQLNQQEVFIIRVIGDLLILLIMLGQ